jgi:hypothetical protein
MNTSNEPATSIFRADVLNVAAAGSSGTLIIYLPKYIASHPRGQIFIAKDRCKSHIYV